MLGIFPTCSRKPVVTVESQGLTIEWYLAKGVNVLRTVRGWIGLTGQIELVDGNLPPRRTAVLLTFLDDDFAAESLKLADVGDYADQLADNEDRLLRGQIQWR